MVIPELIKIRQRFNDKHITDIEGTVRNEIKSSGISIGKGKSIAIAVGSRGIANIDRVAKATVDTVKEMGGNPFIVPAMGSHGGATAEGQKEVLAGYGITEETMDAPIKSSMQVVELPQGDQPNKVYMDKYAYESDGVIIINRIKVHTDFHGPTESGLMKICVIGLGKHKQALEIHRYGVPGLKNLIPGTARQVIKHGKIILGIGLVENAYDKTMEIRALKPSEIEQEEMKLLEINRRNMPKLPVDKLDVLIVDEMGKNVSGSGMDTNIIGRMKIINEKEPESPRITNIITIGITEESHGNAAGMGLADFITKKLFQKVDLKATYENIVTSTFNERGKIPIIAETDRQAVEFALRTCGPIDIENARIIRIKNTLHLSEMYVSKAVLEEIRDKENIEVIGEYRDMFDGGNELIGFNS